MKKKQYIIPQMQDVRLTASYMVMDGISGGPGSDSQSDPTAPEAPSRLYTM